MKKIFQYWIGIFGHPNRILVDHSGEFGNIEFQTLCEHFNIRICTTGIESPWNNSLIERHNAILGLRVIKTMKGINCDLQLSVSWAVNSENSLKNAPSSFQTNLFLRKIQISQTYAMIYYLL